MSTSRAEIEAVRELYRVGREISEILDRSRLPKVAQAELLIGAAVRRMLDASGEGWDNAILRCKRALEAIGASGTGEAKALLDEAGVDWRSDQGPS